MRETALHANDDRLVFFVADDDALQHSLRHLAVPLLLAGGAAFGGALLGGNGLHARDVAADDANARGVLQLAGGPLETQIELLLLQLEDLVLELIGRHAADVFCFHRPYSAIRSMKRVLTGSLAAASVSASFAIACGIPSTSNRILPGLMRTTQSS